MLKVILEEKPSSPAHAKYAKEKNRKTIVDAPNFIGIYNEKL